MKLNLTIELDEHASAALQEHYTNKIEGRDPETYNSLEQYVRYVMWCEMASLMRHNTDLARRIGDTSAAVGRGVKVSIVSPPEDTGCQRFSSEDDPYNDGVELEDVSVF
jgi:hypothetical protein